MIARLDVGLANLKPGKPLRRPEYAPQEREGGKRMSLGSGFVRVVETNSRD